jgi:signal transduction histidine kinase
VALDEFLADAVAGAGVAARTKGVELHYQVAEPVPVVEVATPEMIRVVRNLLDNAIRHTKAPGTVTLAAGVGEGGAAVEVSVLDGCGGIPPEDIDRVFEMGYRGDSARTPGEGRGGLGLAVAQGLVQAHDGHISVTNESAGCRFTVRLPLHHMTKERPPTG